MTNVIKYLQRNSYLFVLGISIIYLLTILAILTYPTAFPSGEYTVKFGAAEINMAAKSYEIINPSFEEGEEQPIGWVPIAWSGSPSFEWSFNMSKSAYRSVKISSSSFTSSAWITHQDYSYKVTPGKVYIGSVYAKTENVANGEGALVSIAWFDANNKYISTTAGSGFIGSFTWKKIRVEGLAPENAAKAELELHLHGTGTVWYDDVEFAEKVDQYQISQLEKTSRKGLDSASIRIDQSELVLIGTFAYPYDEKLIYNKTIKLDTNEFTLMSITYKTSAPNNAGLLIVINYSDGTKVTTYGTSFSLDWTTVYIDLRKTPAYLYYLGDLRQIVPGKELSSIEILLDDRPDTVSEGTYQLLIKNITFYRYASHHLLFSAQSGILLILAAFWGIHSLRSENRRRPIFLLALLGAAISLTATATQLLLPLPAYLNGIDLTLIMQLIGVLLVLAVLITYRYGKFSTGDNYETGNSIPNKVIIGYVLGLILIPSISFLIRFNNAITIPLFDDELSLGLTSWGLLHGSFVGLNLAAFDPVAASLLETGIFNVRAWPNGLSMPFTSTALYPNFSIVEPYLAQPYFVPLVIASSIVILGFNAIAIRLPLIFLNIGTIMLIYLIAARKENVLAGLIASSFFGLTPYSSHYGSEAYLDNSLAFFFLVTIYFLLMYLDNQENGKTHATKYAYLSAVFAALGALSKIQGLITPIFLLLSTFLLGVRRKILLRIALLIISIVSAYPIMGVLISRQGFLLSMKGLILIQNRYATQTLSSWFSGIFSLFDLLSYWSVAIGLLCLVSVLAFDIKVEKEKGFLAGGVIFYLVYGTIFSFKEWYLITVLALIAPFVGYAFSDFILNTKPTMITLFYMIFSAAVLEKLGASLLFKLVFLTPFISLIFIVLYL